MVLALLPCVQSARISAQPVTHGELPPAAKRLVDFKKDIEPIFSTHCVGCHGADKQRSGFRLDDRASAMKGGENHAPAIHPNHSSESPLIRFVAGLVPDMKMPQKGEALNPEQIGLLRAWIDQGAQWPQDAKVGKRLHWSLRPVARPDVPRIANPTRKGIQPIDAFVLTQLRKNRLDFGDPASRGAFIRRMYLVMHGLPPTPEEVRFFVDDADDAQAAKQRPAAVTALAERSFVSVTVLLELEWVMRGFYELPAKDVSRVLRALASIEHITLEDRDAVLVALDAFDKGLDFADALHLARSSRASGFATFDQRLAKRAKTFSLTPKVELLG